MLEAFRKAVLERDKLEVCTIGFFCPETAVVCFPFLLDAGITLGRTQDCGFFRVHPEMLREEAQEATVWVYPGVVEKSLND